MKRLFSAVASLLLVTLLVTTNVSAINLVDRTSVTTRKPVEVITESNKLNDIACSRNLEIPEGYKLEKVIIHNVVMPNSLRSNRNYHEFSTENSQPLWYNNWQIKNFKKDSYRIIYPGSPLRVSTYEGPCTAHMSISDSVSNTFSASSGISVKMVEAKVGYSLSETRTIVDSIDVKVKAGKTLKIKAYALYDQWRMDVYKNGSYVSEEFFHRPVGVSFEQYVFSSN